MNERPDILTQERIARNDSLFREANERIRAAADEHGIDSGTVPFICECAEPACRQVVILDLEEYAEIRRNPRWFMNFPGHEVAAAGAVKVIEQRSHYLIVEKTGHAGEVAEELAETRAPELE